MSSLPELQAIILDKFGVDATKIDPHSPMGEHGMDSLAVVELVFEIEDRMGIRVPEDYNHINTLAGLAEVVDQLRAEKAATTPA
jgi:acyl carrier protein